MESRTFKVPNIGCDGCVRTVESKLSDIKGVQHVKAEEVTQMVTIEWESPADWKRIVDRLTEIDYPPAEA